MQKQKKLEENCYFQFGKHMSKIGQKPITYSGSVQIEIKGNSITVKGKGGEMNFSLPSTLSVKNDNSTLVVERKNDVKEVKALHGLYRSLIANAVAGVETPWKKVLEVSGTGYNVKMQGVDLVFKVGYSHPVVYKKPEGITLSVQGTNKITVQGIDKQLVGEVAYKIKMIKKPDVYKGKGIKYEGEKLRIKPGKKAKTA